jgi:hypothetical protein
MNKHLLSVMVLIGFTFLALFPAATKSITVHSIVAAKLKIHPTPFSKTLTFTSHTAKP